MRLIFIDFTIPHLFADADFPVGGWAVELRTWLGGFRKIGVETAILTKTDIAYSAIGTEETHLLPVYAPRGRIPGVAYLFGFLPRMFRSAYAYNPDIVIQAVAGINTGLMALLARFLCRPFVYRCANDIEVDQRFRERMGWLPAVLYSWGFARADAYIAQNGYQLTEIRKRFPNKPAIVLHNPFQQRSDMPLLPRETRGYVAWLGVFQPQKNLPLLAKVAAALPDIAFHIGGKLEVVMNDGATLAAIERLKSLPNVNFVGYLGRADVPAFLSHAILLLSTSHYEGFSNTFLEAWSTGTPLVAPIRVDPDGLIAKEGLGCAVSEEAEIVGAVRSLIDLPLADYSTLSARCKNYVRNAHDPEFLARRFVDFLHNEVQS